MDSSATNYKIAWFKKEDGSGSLDLTPQFQRRPVWSDEQSSFLMDTILNNLPIPEIYLRSSSTPDGNVRYEVVDGQQRIRSILLFCANDLELVGDDVGAKWRGKSFEDLTDAEKTGFWDYKIVIRDVSGATDIEIRDLFKRLNVNSVVLNDQELRHAQYNGRFIKVMEALADDEWWLDQRVVNVRQVRRMEDVEFISEIFVAMVAGPQDKKKSLDEFYEQFDSSMPLEKEWVKKFESTRELMTSVMTHAQISSWRGKSDFYTLFLAFAQLSAAKLTTKDRKAVADALAAFRLHVDEAKKKTNKKVFAKDVHLYADAVTRAATDLGRREERLKILEARIQKALMSSRKKK